MAKSNNRGFVLAILPVLILLGGLVVGTFLVGQNTNLLQKAAGLFGSQWVNAASLDGNSYIVVTGSEGITPKAGFTAEAWIKPEKTEFYSHIFSRKSPLGGDTFYISVQSEPVAGTSSSKVTYIFGIGSGQSCSNIYAAMQQKTLPPFEVTSWQHLAGVIQTDGQIDIFVNGKRSIGKTIVTNFCTVNVPYTIGARSGGGKVDAQFTGLLDDVRISNTAKYQNDFTPPSAPLIPDSTNDFVLYKFDQPGACNVETQKCYTSNYSPGKYDGELIGKISFVGSMLPTPSPLPTTTSTPISVSPRPTTTSLPTPTTTPSICKTGINSFSVDTPCGNGNYRYATYSCYDGYKVRDGGPTSCKSPSVWRLYAESACRGRSSCPTPRTTIIPTPTVRPTPTATSRPWPSAPILYISVLSPNGGEKLTVGQTYTIKWQTSSGIKNYLIYLVSSSGQLSLINGVSAPTTSYAWRVDSPMLATGTLYKIKVMDGSTGGTGDVAQDTSDNFFTISSSNFTNPPTPYVTPTATSQPIMEQIISILNRAVATPTPPSTPKPSPFRTPIPTSVIRPTPTPILRTIPPIPTTIQIWWQRFLPRIPLPSWWPR